MRGDEAQKSETARALLEGMCAQNRSAEVHYWRGDELCSARMRLLDISDDEIRVDKPQCIGREVILRHGTSLTVYFSHSGTLYAFKSKVTKPILRFDLNHRKSIVGMALKVPTEVSEEQRRHDFRLSLARYDITATLHETSPQDVNSAPISAAQFAGRLINISATGLGMLFDTDRCPKCSHWDIFYIQYCLPKINEPFVLLVEVRHARAIHDGLEKIVGFKFLDTRELLIKVQLRHIAEFLAAEQRRQLNTRRRSG